MDKRTNNDPFIISYLGKKGGGGKTTCAINTAIGFVHRNFKTLLIDSDPLQNTRDWRDANTQKCVSVIGADRPNLLQDLKDSQKDYDVIVIDGASQIEEISISAMKISDLVLIPIQPASQDVWGVSSLVGIIKYTQKVFSTPKHSAFIISREIKDTALSKKIRSTLEEYEIPVLKNGTSNYMTYPNTIDRGQSVFDTNSNAKKEFTLIIDEIIENYIGV